MVGGRGVVFIWTPVRPNFNLLCSVHHCIKLNLLCGLRIEPSNVVGVFFSVTRIDLEEGVIINARPECVAKYLMTEYLLSSFGKVSILSNKQNMVHKLLDRLTYRIYQGGRGFEILL